MAFDPDGDLVITGTFDGTIDLGGEMVTATGDRDTFLLTMSRSGEITSVATQAAPAGTENLLSVDHVDAAAGRLVAAQLEAGLDLGGEAFSALGSVDTVVGRLRP